jgi:hypothetical protein
MSEQQFPAALEVFGASPTPVVVTVVPQPLARRIGRALLAAATFFLLAVAAVFIPLAHFVLVPGLAIAGVVVAASKLREDRRLARIQGRCPRCRTEMDVAPGGRFRAGRTLECPHCLNTLTLVGDGQPR